LIWSRALLPFIGRTSPVVGKVRKSRLFTQVTSTPLGESDGSGQSHAIPCASGGLGDASGAVAHVGSSGSVLR
jgi:hypothetical protein